MKTGKTPLDYFCEISAIPRASGNEAGIASYLCAFAEERGIFCLRDAMNNVFMKKPGSKGREQEPPILLQAHTDMVAEQNGGTGHDFENEGIELVFEGNILRANGTTLGADDGFGVAIMLAVLDDDTLSHPPVECLFTVSEETGMGGVLSFDFSAVSAARMLNLDSAGEQEAITGCCGGLRHDLTLPLTFAPYEGDYFELSLTGLFGGHSGEDIHKGRLNAHVTMGKLLRGIRAVSELRICEISGGDKDNAIPRECRARIAVKDGNALVACFPQLTAQLRAQLVAKEDAPLSITLLPCEKALAMSEAQTEAVLAITALPNGVLEWLSKEPPLPFFSTNLARIRTEQDRLCVGFSTRSPAKDRIDRLRASLDAFAAEKGGSVRHHAAYPGWENPEGASIVSRWQEAYRHVTGQECHPTVIHAGLECGVISAALPGLEAVAIGCNIYDLHTPRERMELDSFARIYQCVVRFLEIC